MGNIRSVNLDTYAQYDSQYDNMVASTASLRLCIGCLEEKPKTEFKNLTPRCRGHHTPDMCAQCVTIWIHRSVNDRGTRVTCPQCPIELDYFDIKELADAATFRKYETLVLSRVLEEDPRFEWCAHACGSGQIHPAAADEPIMTCHNCHKRTCVVHKLPWHSGFTCRQFDARVRALGQGQDKETATAAAAAAASLRSREQRLEEQRALAILQRAKDDEASREEVRRTSKACPNCKSDIEKDSGCDNMTCVRCGHGFCWICFIPYHLISRFGNSQHMRDCKWYRP
ncbi:hypothetical protein F4859DRAFT_389142 [Xylaria cf. heliscus]|nr:hypothetical protein F4859DRAFT_389142 [Xylaria cf. heliscus]